MTPLQVTRVAGFGKKPPQSFTQSPVIFGTGAGCSVRFDAAWDKGVAAQHVKLEWINNYWSLSDVGSPSGTWIDGRKLTQAYPVTGPVEFELGKGGPRCRVEPLGEPAGQSAPAPAYANAPVQRPAPVYQSKQPSSGPSPAVLAVIGGVVLLLAAGAAWYFLDYRKEHAPLDMASSGKMVTLPPGIDEHEHPVNPPAPKPSPDPSPNPHPAPQPTPQPTPKPSNPFVPGALPDGDPGQPDMAAKPTGLVELSPEQKQWSRAHFPAVAGVRLNKNALSRLQSNSTYSVDTPAAPLGDELVFRKPGDATFANGANEPDLDTPSHLEIAVDNSTKPTFPSIGEQSPFGSCACFSSVYYALSNNIAVARGLNAPVLFSPLWVYSMLNRGRDKGSCLEEVYSMLQYHGAVTLATLPYPDEQHATPADCLRWQTDPAKWREALQYRVNEVGTINDLDTPEGLQRLKAYLSNGFLANYRTQIFDHDHTPHVGWTDNWGVAKANPELSAQGNAVAGEPVLCCATEAPDGGHAMTIVGYNDDVWIDFNNDGKVQPEEKGALKVVNSWGTDYPRRKDGGFAWISYDALKSHSQFPWIDQPHRIPAVEEKQAWVMLPGKEVKPAFLAQFTLSNAQRDEIDVSLGASSLDSKEPTETWRPVALATSDLGAKSHYSQNSATGGPLAFDGGSKEIPGTFVFDATYVASAANLGKVEGYRIYLIVHDLRPDHVTTISDYRITTPDGQPIAIAEGLSKKPITVDNSTVIVPLEVK